jgi:ribosomal protein S18 acetylase RimI-like enzyme
MIAAFMEKDIPHFLALAAEERWICERWEFDFLLRTFPQGCLVWREDGRTLGFVTSIRYGKSGWIGNLLVDPDHRRCGIARELLETAILTLLASWVETVWLTASVQGAGLYSRMGFTAVDTINRWTGRGKGDVGQEEKAPDLEVVNSIDVSGWGDRRHALINETCRRGRLLGGSDGFICAQKWEHGTQVGPWGCRLEQEARQLLDRALSRVDDGMFLDVPQANDTATALLTENGFSIKGSNLLMYFGARPHYRPKNIYALASMGSMG